MRKILILTGRYLPSNKDGEPLQTFVNIINALGNEYNFYMACYDRDYGNKESNKNILDNEWNQIEKSKVF